MDQTKKEKTAGAWQERETPRSFEEKAYRLQQGFVDWLDTNPDRLKLGEEGDWIVTRMVELLLFEKAAECSSRRRVEMMRLVAADVMAKAVQDPETLQKVEFKIDEMFKDLEIYDEMGLNDSRYKAKVRALAEKVTGKKQGEEKSSP
ncbi:MAG: hypothetical protein WAO55_15260 [Candidatus Manganitrophaceae bacterium]